MATLNIDCRIFDPIRITTLTRTNKFIVDTWFSTGLIANSLYRQLPGIEVVGTGELHLSSGMTVHRPLLRVGIQINNIRALPIDLFVVDDGPAPLLLGSDFVRSLFKIGAKSPATLGSSGPITPGEISLDVEEKYDPESIGIRLLPIEGSIETLQLERFLRGIRAVHNIGIIANSGLHQHDDWPDKGSEEKKRQAVRETIRNDRSLGSDNTLVISWIEEGSVWLSLKTGAKAAMSWLAQIFEKSMDARLRSTISAAALAEEEVQIKQLTREEIANAKSWEQRRFAANQIRQTREEWRKLVLGEIDFRKKLTERISDPIVRKEAEQSLQQALSDLVDSDFLPIIEHVPLIPADSRDALSVRRRSEQK
jgi:hypothetical protein